MKKDFFKELRELILDLIRLEITTTAGKVNLLGMILAFILVIALSLPSWLEAAIRLIHPNVNVGTPVLEPLVAFLIFTLICTGMLGYLEGPRNRFERQPDEELKQRSKDRPGSGPGPRA
jgi:hypothetical protein